MRKTIPNDLADCCQCLLNANLRGLIRVDHGFRMHDRFESRLNVQVELEVAVSCGMRGAGIVGLQSSADSFLRAETFQDSPWLRKGCGGRQYVVDLVSPREGAS